MKLYLYQNDQQVGPFTESQIKEMVASGSIQEIDLCWHEGLSDWQPINAVLSFPKRTIKSKLNYETFKARLFKHDLGYKYQSDSYLRRLYEEDHPLSFGEEAENLFYICKEDTKTGPYVKSQIESMWSLGQLTADSMVEEKYAKVKYPILEFIEDKKTRKLHGPESPFSIEQLANPLRAIGLILLLGGLVCAGFFFTSFETSVTTESKYISGLGHIGGQQVENIGRLNQRQNGITIGIGVAILGAILIVAANKNKENS
jgi:hypothetical protein